MDRKLTRKNFLKVAGAGAVGGALLAASGCGEIREQVEQRVPERIRLLGRPERNVVLIISDTLRKDHIGAYGNDWIQTPSMDALAADSLRFTRAYPESIPSIPARRSIHTGIRTWPFLDWESPYEDDVQLYGWQPMPAGQTTLARLLSEAGMVTSLVTDTLHQFRPFYNFHDGFGSFNFVRGQERDLYRPASLSPPEKLEEILLGGPNEDQARRIMGQYLANTMGREREEDWFAPQVFSTAMEYLEGFAAAGDPFFLTVDVYDPHEPWDPPEEYTALYDDDYDGPEPSIASSGESGWLSERQLKRMKALYAGEVTMVDRWLGNFLDKMEELNLMENTLVVFASDHGHAFGEHGFAGKVSSAMYYELTDVPLMIRSPEGKAAGETSDFFASTHDIQATILGFLGVGASGESDSLDLMPLLDGEQPEEERPHFSMGYHDHAWARDEEYIMFCANDGSDAHLFDAAKDPKQNTDLAEENPDIVQKMYDDYIIADAGGEAPPSY